MSLLQQNSSRKRVLLGQDGNALVMLIVINVLAYIVLNFVKLLYLFNDSTADVFQAQVLNWMSVPAPPTVFATRPWTLISYMFTHSDIWDLLGSMLWLLGFGHVLQTLTGNRLIFPLFLYGGFAGGIVFLLTCNLIPAISENINSVWPLIGAGPALMGLAIGATAIEPQYRLFRMINLPLWVVTALFIVVMLGFAGAGNIGQIAALIAGGGMGYLFVWQLKKGNDWGQWMTDVVNWAGDLFNPEKKNNEIPAKNRLFYKSTQKPFEKTPHVTQQRIDELLDKISQKGYFSLTEEEKEFLKKASSEDF